MHGRHKRALGFDGQPADSHTTRGGWREHRLSNHAVRHANTAGGDAHTVVLDVAAASGTLQRHTSTCSFRSEARRGSAVKRAVGIMTLGCRPSRTGCSRRQQQDNQQQPSTAAASPAREPGRERRGRAAVHSAHGVLHPIWYPPSPTRKPAVVVSEYGKGGTRPVSAKNKSGRFPKFDGVSCAGQLRLRSRQTPPRSRPPLWE